MLFFFWISQFFQIIQWILDHQKSMEREPRKDNQYFNVKMILTKQPASEQGGLSKC